MKWFSIKVEYKNYAAFTTYTQGISMKEVAKRLKDEGYKIHRIKQLKRTPDIGLKAIYEGMKNAPS